MFRTLTPLFALIVAVSLFFTYIRPTFDEMKAVQDETNEYAAAVDKAEQLRQRISELIAERNSISQTDLERLEVFLPDRVDEVQLLIAIDALAESNNLQLSNIDAKNQSGLTTEEALGLIENAGAQNRTSAAPQGYIPYDMSFVVTGTYDDFRAFLEAIEQSLTFTDIIDITFSAPEADDEIVNDGNIVRPITVRMSIRTYSLAPTN